MFHIVHNLGDEYQGRIYLDGEENWQKLAYWTELPDNYIIDKTWEKKVINPSRSALMCSDQWATVSKTYQKEILCAASLKDFLFLKTSPFAFPNGVDGKKIKQQQEKLSQHHIEKENILKEFFGFEQSSNLDDVILFGFIGRICAQKGVLLILEIVESILHFTKYKAYFLIGGMIDGSEYSMHCSNFMSHLAKKYPKNFWGNPNLFFNKGLQLNRAADFFLMPSFFEPGGIVQHEALISGTPVIAFKTGGLNDTIFEYSCQSKEGNGFLFTSHNSHDFRLSVEKAIQCFYNKESYSVLRKNCEISFMDISRVTRAWRGEFFRLCDKVYSKGRY